EVVSAEIKSEAQGAVFVEVAGVIASNVVTVIAPRIDEWAVGVGTIISDERVRMFQPRTVRHKTAVGIIGTALHSRGQKARQTFLKANLNYSQPGKVPIFRAEGTVENI